jgi:hypothetical protein
MVPELHGAAWWAENLKSFNFHDADRLDTGAFNRILWKGIMGDVPYPTARSGMDLRKNRAQLLKRWEASKKSQTGNAVPVAMVTSPR